ncbi:helix-turn-helix transcriptional regulator [Halegenticoccus soli]|uniref:helix-turn-helix transcriptional regulator n=1 Tax=Halegenticoccus soli TaxID=1985678 RepID=UPI0018ED0A34|nr:helix-turn-helix domain-containing protein [Halegenticoccus soli]
MRGKQSLKGWLYVGLVLACVVSFGAVDGATREGPSQGGQPVPQGDEVRALERVEQAQDAPVGDDRAARGGDSASPERLLRALGTGAVSFVESLLADASNSKRSHKLVLAILLGHTELTTSGNRLPRDVSHGSAIPSQPLQADTGGSSGGEPDGVDAVALLLSLVTILVSVGLAVYQRFFDARAVSRPPEMSVPEPRSIPSDKDRIRELVEEHGGRMKQSQIVDRVDWSKAKVSRLLSQLDEEGEITKLRLGRENLICLSGHEPPASRSPFSGEEERN